MGILGGETRRIQHAKTGTTVIMLVGLQGAGKTTSVAKLARYLQEREKKKVMVVCQWREWGDQM